MLPTSRYDERRADFAVNFIQMLKHTTGEWYGKPFHLMPWQEQIVRDIFGIVGEDGYRQFRTAYVEIDRVTVMPDGKLIFLFRNGTEIEG